MASTVSTTFTSGEDGAKKTQSCIPVAAYGSGDEFSTTSYYYASCDLSIKVEEDGSVWIKCDSLSFSQTVSNPSGTSWDFWGLYVDLDSFSVYQAVGDSTPTWQGSGLVQVYSSASVAFDGAGSAVGSYLDGGSSTGWQRIASSIEELDHNDDLTEAYIYVLGVVDIPGVDTTSGLNISALRITLSSFTPPLSTLFEYYPFDRFTGSLYESLNRDGPSQAVTGLFRSDGSTWQKVLNKEYNADESKGFRHDGSSWQIGAKTS